MPMDFLPAAEGVEVRHTKPQIKMRHDGSVVASLVKCDGTNTRLQSEINIKNSVRSNAKTIVSLVGEFPDFEYKLAICSGAHVYAVWNEPAGDLQVVKASVLYFKEGEWATPVVLADSVSSVRDIQLVFNSGCNGMAVWTDDEGVVQTVLFRNESRDDWVVSRIESPARSASHVRIVFDLEGTAVMVWEEMVYGEVFVMGAYLPAGGDRWIRSSKPLSGPGCHSPQFAVGGTGEASVVWVDGGEIQFSTLRLEGDEWSLGVENLSGEGVVGSEPRVVVDVLGNTTVVWRAVIGGNSVIQSAVREVEGNWLPVVNVSSGNGNAVDAEIEIDDVGSVWVVWRNIFFENNVVVVQFSKLSVGGVWSKPLNLYEFGEKVGIIQVSVGKSARIAMIWEDQKVGTIKYREVGFSSRTIKPEIRIDGAVEWDDTRIGAPTVVGVSPNTGPAAGGTTVIITGTNFIGITGLFIGGVAANAFTIMDSATIIATVPASWAGTFYIVVIGDNGESNAGPSCHYTYLEKSLPSPETKIDDGGNAFFEWGDITSVYNVVAEYLEVISSKLTSCGELANSAICDYDYNNQDSSILSPSKFLGFIERYIDGDFLRMSWSRSLSPNVICYRIYKGRTVVAQVTEGQLWLKLRHHCRPDCYTITAVDDDGHESNHVRLVIISG